MATESGTQQRSTKQPTSESSLFRDAPKVVSIVAWTISLLAILFVPAAELQTNTLHAFRVDSFVGALLILLAISGVVMAIVYFVTRDTERMVRYTAAVMFVLFWWVTIFGLVLAPAIPPSISGTLLMAGIVYLIVSLGRSWPVMVSLTALLVLLALVQVNEIRQISVMSFTPTVTVEATTAGDDAPNVFVLMLDGHPRGDTLVEFYDTSNEEALAALEALGFTVKRDAMSNYNRTYAAVASMMTLETFVSDTMPSEDIWPAVRAVNGGDGVTLQAFSDAGYEVTSVPSAWFGSRCGDIVDHCHRIGGTYSNLYWLLRRTPLASFVPRLMVHPWTAVSTEQIESMSDIHAKAAEGESPSIVWMHAVLPHPPVVYDAACDYHNDAWRNVFDLTKRDADDARRVAVFGEQVLCVDSMVVAQVEAIIDSDPSAVILIVADHGPDAQLQPRTPIAEYDDAQIREKIAIINAVRAPDRCDELLSSPSTVGTFRGLVNCVLGASVAGGDASYYLVPPEAGIELDEPPIHVPDDEMHRIVNGG